MALRCMCGTRAATSSADQHIGTVWSGDLEGILSNSRLFDRCLGCALLQLRPIGRRLGFDFGRHSFGDTLDHLVTNWRWECALAMSGRLLLVVWRDDKRIIRMRLLKKFADKKTQRDQIARACPDMVPRLQ